MNCLSNDIEEQRIHNDKIAPRRTTSRGSLVMVYDSRTNLIGNHSRCRERIFIRRKERLVFGQRHARRRRILVFILKSYIDGAFC